MRPKVSVIIPVYKAEKDIEKCCNALFKQTLEEIEYIFVEDCTPDNSVSVIKKVLDKYPARKEFVKILHQPQNSGVSACRQFGLDNASGEYIIHCDSDDWPDTNMYQELYTAAIVNNAEIVYCDYMAEYIDNSVYVQFPNQYKDRPSFNIGPVEGAVWNKLISRNLIDRCGAKFYSGINLGEDFGFVTPCRVMSKKNIVLHKPLYHYNQQNSNSITHNYTKDRFMQVVSLAKKTDDYFKSRGLEKEYEKGLSYLKFQAKGFFLMFKDVRDIALWKNLFPESNRFISEYDYPKYVKIAALLIDNNMTLIAKLLLNLKSLIRSN
jgi:glycosyltransferase involved in cell wall biosynthesis